LFFGSVKLIFQTVLSTEERSMTMPRDLLVVRHGESEGNVAQAAVKRGDDSLMKQLDTVHTEQWRLSPLGRQQARAAGEWVRREFPEGFSRYLTSWYVRAMETSVGMNLPGAEWFPHIMLSERNWGRASSATAEERRSGPVAADLARRRRDGIWWSPAGGESVAETMVRLHEVLDAQHREQSDGRVVMVCHGEIMWALRVLLERLPPWLYRELDKSSNPHDRIHNCQIFHYTRVNPSDPSDVCPRLEWVRSVCPWDTTLSSNKWREITRRRFNNDELRAAVERCRQFMPQGE
jgi:NAD+ kinase